MAKPHTLLARLLQTPDLPAIVPRLQPEVLHRVIQACGLEDCGEFVALATPAQITRLLDLDVWRGGGAGRDDILDGDRFGLWIDVLVQCGPAVAAEKLLALDRALVVSGLMEHVIVYDQAVMAGYTTLDGERVPARHVEGPLVGQIGGYVIKAVRTSAWEAIVELLAFLAAEQPVDFHRVMRGCVRLSHGTRELDGLDDLLGAGDQQMFDVAAARETRREQQGYVSPAQAHAFLRAARDVGIDAPQPPPSAIARAYFRAIESALADADVAEHAADANEGPAFVSAESAGAVEVLREAGLLAPPRRALPGAVDAQDGRLSFIDHYIADHPESVGALAYLANALLAGCAIQGRPFTEREAADGAVATCNLGLENWPPCWPDTNLIDAFQVGWAILHRDVCMEAARRVIEVLDEVRCIDRNIQLRLDGLRRALRQHLDDREPWRARGDLDVIMMLDPPSWAGLLALLAECPVSHGAVSGDQQSRLSIDATAFEFISENRQIAQVRRFLASLLAALTA